MCASKFLLICWKFHWIRTTGSNDNRLKSVARNTIFYRRYVTIPLSWKMSFIEMTYWICTKNEGSNLRFSINVCLLWYGFLSLLLQRFTKTSSMLHQNAQKWIPHRMIQISQYHIAKWKSFLHDNPSLVIQQKFWHILVDEIQKCFNTHCSSIFSSYGGENFIEIRPRVIEKVELNLFQTNTVLWNICYL